jgi:hypothetical protein
MNHLLDRVFALCGLSLLLAAVWMGQLVHAQDELPPPLPTPPGAHLRQILIADHVAPKRIVIITQGGPDWAHLPPVGQFFKAGCNGPTFCEEVLERLQAPAQASNQPIIDLTPKFIGQGCACAAAGECVCASHPACGEECAAAKADSCKCCPCADHAVEATCGEDGCQAADILIQRVQHVEQLEEHHPLKLMQHIAGLVGEKAAAQAALAVRKEADDQIGELVETMAELLADNAALDAKLEAQNEAHAEQRKLLEKVADLAAENARLKAHVELAAERAEIIRSTATLTLENERLKLRIVELEQKHALAEAARTAAKPKERKAR